MKLAVVVFLCAGVALAHNHKKHSHSHSHREHGAHQHGAGQLGIAFEGANGKIEFKSPSESIFGFEHEARSEGDKKRQQEGLAKLENKISEIVVFDSSLNCRISKEKIEVVRESAAAAASQDAKPAKKAHKHAEHSETVAMFAVACDKSPVGTEITFNFQKHFPRLKDVDVQVIADAVQKAAEAKKNGVKIQLK